MGRPKGAVSRQNMVREYHAGDKSKRETLIASYTDMAQEIALKYTGLGLDDEDLIQSAYEGLIVGVDKCLNNAACNNIAKTIQRSIRQYVVYAVGKWINYKGINHHFSCEVSTIVEVLRIRRALLIDLGREPTLEEVGEQILIGLSTIKSILDRKDNYYIKYLDDLTDDEKTFVIDGVVDPTIDILNKLLLEDLKNLEFSLSLRQLEYINHRLNGYNTEDIIRLMGVSRQRVSDIKLKITEKLKKIEVLPDLLYGEDQKRESLEEEKRFTNRRKRDRQNNRYRY